MGSEKLAEHDRLFTEYVTTQLEHLRRLAFVLCQDAHRADDLVQEAITKLYLTWHTIHKVTNLDRYVRAIVVREFLNTQRLGWARRVRLSDRPPEGNSPQAASVEDRLVLQAALKQMPPRQRKPAIDFDARRVRNGWVTGYLMLDQGRTAGVRWDLVTGKVDLFDQVQWSNDVSPHGWIVGRDRADDAVLTDGTGILKLPNVFPKPADYGMNWAEAISDDGLTIVGHNDDKTHDGEQRGVVWKCH